MRRITIFSFGYYGWGTSTEQLVKAADAVEKSRGFRPPMFVDIRIRRQGRATGFVGNAFGELLSPRRHRWMRDLGNERILTRTGPLIQIRRPAAAAELLDLAVEADAERRRVIFFCSCQFPQQNGKVTCHRHTVSLLVLKEARKQGVRVEVVEWPGGEPQHLQLKITPELLAAVARGRTAIPVSRHILLSQAAGLPWASTVSLRADGATLNRIVGPAIWRNGGWSIPIPWSLESAASLREYQQHVQGFRRKYGMEPRRS